MITPVRKLAAERLEKYVQQRFQRGQSVFDVRVVTPRGAYARRRVVVAEGVVIEDRELRVPAAPEPVPPAIEGEVIEGEVVDASTRRLESGD